MRYLTQVQETYRLPNEKEVEKFLNELKADNRFIVKKYSSVKKERKQKGEIIDEWIQFTVVKLFNDEKEPNTEVTIDYNVNAVWRGPVSTEEDDYE